MLKAVLQLLLFWTILLPLGDGATVDVRYDLIYRVGDEGALRLDLYLPKATPGPHPVVVIVHGGVWALGHNRDYIDLCKHLAANGIAVAPILYERVPREGWTAQVGDVKDAIRWLRSNARALDLDPDRVGLFGSSAGGHLAGLAGLISEEEEPDLGHYSNSSDVQALFLLYAAYDITGLQDTALARYYMGGLGTDFPEEHVAWFCHDTHVNGTEPPTFIMHGTADTLVPVEQAVALHDHLVQVGVDAELELVEGGVHGFAKVTPGTRPMVADAMLRFFGGQFLGEVT